VPVHETVRGFMEIVSGGVDHIPEQYFFMKGTIGEVYAAFKAASTEAGGKPVASK
jgi:F-type H+-transporting ATPase subunit beta